MTISATKSRHVSELLVDDTEKYEKKKLKRNFEKRLILIPLIEIPVCRLRTLDNGVNKKTNR